MVARYETGLGGDGMAQVRIMYWKESPYAVRASEGNERASRQLPTEFQEAIDAAAMFDGDTAAEAYQAGFRWGPPEERPGTAASVAEAVVAEIVTAFPGERLARLARREAT
ncbi:MAG TPA: virulence factor [Candidatus Polarisedimenticolia bacterium]|nr:virulence factor [Candidatus Polarisedimenticolia bacterium]